MAQVNAKYIRIAAITAILGNGVLAATKIIAGAFSGSGALIGDGVDSLSDVAISAMTLVVVKLMTKPADSGHPWGHGRAETIATAFLSFTLFFVGAQLIYNSVSGLIFGAPKSAPSFVALIATVISICGKLALAASQSFLGKRSGSALIKANAKNMAGDVIISVGVLLGLAVSTFTGSGIADAIIAVLIGLWIVKTAIMIVRDVFRELMDGGEGGGEYRTVFAAVKTVEGAYNPHRARMRRIAGFWDVDLDIEVSPDITVLEAHKIACLVEKAIKERLDNVYDIVIHVEPRGDANEEGFGLSEDELP